MATIILPVPTFSVIDHVTVADGRQNMDTSHISPAGAASGTEPPAETLLLPPVLVVIEPSKPVIVRVVAVHAKVGSVGLLIVITYPVAVAVFR